MYAGDMKQIWPVLGMALFLVVVGLGVYLWRVGLSSRSGVELVVRTDKVAVFMDDEQALVDWFATHGWWETGVRTIDAVVGGTAAQVTPTSSQS